MTNFTIYPAIDIRGGQCVRLLQGDYNQETVYGTPVEMAERWVSEGAHWLHLVDLDGAKEGKPVNGEVIKKIASGFSIPVQVGGGIRSMETITDYLESGVSRVILGTSAIENRPFVEEALKRYGEKVAIGIDARNGWVATRGWLETSEMKAEELALSLISVGAEVFIYTDISRDGTLQGPNIEAMVQLAKTTKKQVIASGGVSQLTDLQQLASFSDEGVSGAIVGKALYTGQFTLKNALLELGASR